MDDARIPSSEQLMAEMGWVRQLARSLVRNDALADDIAQDTWLVAERQQPDADRPLRPWLARVVTNLARTRRTSEARRDRRNTAYDEGRTPATPAELIERVELQRALAGEVLALAEPYRSTVLLHFFEGCTSAEIARRLGVPDGTVRRRLKVALDQLREALRRRDDPPEGGWLAALVPFAQLPSSPHVSTTMGVIAMKKLIGVILVLLLLLVGGGVLWVRHAHDATAPGGTGPRGTGAGGALAGGDGSSARATIPDWVVKPGVPARRIAGQVVFHGVPVGGAKVVLGLDIADQPAPVGLAGAVPALVQPLAEVTTGADGTFDFGVQPATEFSVSASAASHSPTAVHVDNVRPQTPSDHLVIRLGDCGQTMSGTIADASGGPIAKARLTVAAFGGAESDASGHYSLCMQPGQNMGTPMTRVRVEADGYGALSRFVLTVGTIHQDFLLVPEAVVVGRVTTAAGEPVPGAHVLAEIEPIELVHDLSSRWAESDRDGRFRITGLAPGSFQLWAEARGMHSARVPIVARPTKSSPEIHLVLEQAQVARVTGHVTRRGKPASGVTLMAVQGDPVGTSTSQADGSFVFDRVPYGATSFFAPPEQPDRTKQIDISRPEVANVSIEITHVSTISGHVTRKGKPIAGAQVSYIFAPQATIFGAPPVATADASGAYTLDVPSGPGQVFAWDSPSKAFGNPRAFSPAPDEDQTIDLELDLAGEVRGTVVDQNGALVAGAYVRLDLAKGDDSCEAVADSKGQFDCAELAGGTYYPSVTPFAGARTGFAPAAGEHFDPIEVPSDGVTAGIQLAIKNERLAIRGTVVDDTGAPLADVRIDAVSRGPSSMGFPSTLSDTAGNFEISNLAAGTYDLQARAADGGAGDLRDVAAGTRTAALKVMRPGEIEGTLTGFTSTPVVFVLGANEPGRGGRAIVDGNAFSRIALPPGQYLVNAMAGSEADGQTVEVAPGEIKHVDLHSRGVASIEGTVSELASKAPVPGMRCDAHLALGGQMTIGPPDPAHQAFTDAVGHFVLNAPVGRARVLCFALGGGPLSTAGTEIEVATGGRANVNVTSVRATYGDKPGNAGFMLAPGTLPLAVGMVVPDGPAKGLRVGDQLVSIDGVAVDGLTPDGAMTLIMNHRAGSSVTLGIQRGGATQTLKVVLGAGPPG